MLTLTSIDSTQVIIIKKGSNISSSVNLENKNIGVLLGTVGFQYAQEKIENANMQRYNNGDDMLLALINGEIDAAIVDDKPAKEFEKK